ncbi:MAG: DUF2842 domain-containing protein [Alphaproteobacteria bacterium]
MSGGARRAIAGAAIVAYLIAYVVLAATVGGYLVGMPWFVQLGFYVIAGAVWVFPLRPLFTWMGRTPKG